MLCFRATTFCAAKCSTAECPRHWDETKRAAADRWWSGFPGDAPVAFSDFSEGCPEYKPDDAHD